MDASEIAQKLSATLSKGQAVKTSALGQATTHQGAVVQALQLEQQRTEALHGPGSQKFQTVQALAAAHASSLAQTQATATRAQARAPLPNPKEFIIYGYVTDESGAPLKDVDVSVADAKGSILKTDTTIADGSYALHISAATEHHKPCKEEGGLEQFIEKVEDVVEKGAEEIFEDEGERRSGAGQAAPASPLKLMASDQRKTFLIQSPTEFQFELGKLAYQDLTVPSGSIHDR